MAWRIGAGTFYDRIAQDREILKAAVYLVMYYSLLTECAVIDMLRKKPTKFDVLENKEETLWVLYWSKLVSCETRT